jgi:hypothetical protein
MIANFSCESLGSSEGLTEFDNFGNMGSFPIESHESAIQSSLSYMARRKNFTDQNCVFEGILCPQSARMRKPSKNISGDRRKNAVATINRVSLTKTNFQMVNKQIDLIG